MKPTLALFLLMAGTSVNAKPFYRSGKFWTGAAVIAGVITLDCVSSQRAINRGAIESNTIFGATPQQPHVLRNGLADFAIEEGLHIGVWELGHVGRPDKYRNLFGDVTQPVVSIAWHLPATVHNFGIQPRISPVLHDPAIVGAGN